MALRDQPYIPLYVQDFLTDEKLIECSAETTGVYIRLLCIMHKSEEYGTVLLKQKDKQNLNVCLNFAIKLSKQMPYTVEIIKRSLKELLEECVICWDDKDKLFQKRMIKDNKLSVKRASAGKKGGIKTQNFAKAKDKANSENEYENEYESKSNKKKKVEKKTFDFESVWAQHPNKLGRKEAEGYFNTTVMTDEDFKNINKAVKNFNNHIEETN
ncbi:unnamed protein product, partial [marine sediment metagenome]